MLKNLTWCLSIGSRERKIIFLRHKLLLIFFAAYFFSCLDTIVSTLKVEDMLEVAINIQVWKARILLLMEENDLKDYVEMVIPDPNDALEF
jgi:hypothetical protein